MKTEEGTVSRLASKKVVFSLLGIIVAIVIGLSMAFMPKKIDATFFDESGKLSVNVLSAVSADLEAGRINLLLVNSPDLIAYIFSEVETITINGSDEEVLDSEYLIELLMFFDDVNLASFEKNNYPEFEYLLSTSEDNSAIKDLASLWVKHSQTASSLTKLEEQSIATAILYLTIRTDDYSPVSQESLLDYYRSARAQNSEFRILESSLLQSLWLNEFKEIIEMGDDVQSVADKKHKLVSTYRQINQALNTSGDLIRLLNHKNRDVVIGSAALIRTMAPKNALHALRYHIVRSQDEEVKLILLDALAAYGNSARVYESQLKQLMRMSKSDAVKKKIQLVLKNMNGHSV